MAKTFREFMVECEMYPYSAEHYELQKECAELQLMGKYIADQQFLRENADMIAAAGIDASYMKEAADTATMESMEAAFTEKADGIWSKIKTGFLNVIRGFKSLMVRMFPIFDGLNNRAKALVKAINNSDKPQEEIHTICSNAVAAARKKSDGNFPVRPNQPFASNIKKVFSGANGATKTLRDDIAAALSTSVVVAEAKAATGTAIGAVDFDSFKAAANGLCAGRKGKTAKGAHETLSGAWKDSQANGVKIKVNTEAIRMASEALKQMEEKLKSLEAEKGDAAAKEREKLSPKYDVGDDTAREDPAFAAAQAMDAQRSANDRAGAIEDERKLLTELTASCSATMALYTSLNAYRASVINSLEGGFGLAKDK